ncbi:glycine-rich RNA-binding protein 2, mitochondrial-like isoform X1 [Panicum hallii]|uniref:glycine-rich RNA-binding protein 2, mitochondrial-like isoform X1 n=1 Tax=Panicum hallii TaxID=206008 RepID=UPI000DF4E4D2|nr:glycine-rich RNA-binding protein 2, mitochondrial-like isoform X1 [Panicum hallii]
MALNRRGWTLLRLRCAATPFGKLFNRTAASSSGCTSKLFVGGLSYDTNETALKDAFSRHGDVIAVKVICHPTTGKSKGFGFVTFSSQDEAAAAAHKMNGARWEAHSGALLKQWMICHCCLFITEFVGRIE